MSGNGVRVKSDPSWTSLDGQLLICDVDNTLYDFGIYYEAGLAGLLPFACAALDLKEQEVLERLRVSFAHHGSIEYPYAFEEFPELSAWPKEARRALARELMEVFWAAARAELRAYPGVHTTLHHLKRDRIHVVAFTDAPKHEAFRRLRELRIDQYLSGLVATEWFPTTRGTTRVLRLQDLPGHRRIPSRFHVTGSLSDGQRKPNSETYAAIAEAYGVSPEQVVVVGDSPTRDLAPAHQIGMRAIWAAYGVRNASKERLLRAVVPFVLPEAQRSVAPEASEFMKIRSFPEILRFMATQQVLELEP